MVARAGRGGMSVRHNTGTGRLSHPRMSLYLLAITSLSRDSYLLITYDSFVLILTWIKALRLLLFIVLIQNHASEVFSQP